MTTGQVEFNECKSLNYSNIKVERRCEVVLFHFITFTTKRVKHVVVPWA